MFSNLNIFVFAVMCLALLLDSGIAVGKAFIYDK